jgi:hypothetical protein
MPSGHNSPVIRPWLLLALGGLLVVSLVASLGWPGAQCLLPTFAGSKRRDTPSARTCEQLRAADMRFPWPRPSTSTPLRMQATTLQPTATTQSTCCRAARACQRGRGWWRHPHWRSAPRGAGRPASLRLGASLRAASSSALPVQRCPGALCRCCWQALRAWPSRSGRHEQVSATSQPAPPAPAFPTNSPPATHIQSTTSTSMPPKKQQRGRLTEAEVAERSCSICRAYACIQHGVQALIPRYHATTVHTAQSTQTCAPHLGDFGALELLANRVLCRPSSGAFAGLTSHTRAPQWPAAARASSLRAMATAGHSAVTSHSGAIVVYVTVPSAEVRRAAAGWAWPRRARVPPLRPPPVVPVRSHCGAAAPAMRLRRATTQRSSSTSAPVHGALGCTEAQSLLARNTANCSAGHIARAAPAGCQVGDALAGKVVEAQLAACVNILPGVTSVYRWEGKVGACRRAWGT